MAMGVGVEGVGVAGVEHGMESLQLMTILRWELLLVRPVRSCWIQHTVGMVEESREEATARSFLGEKGGGRGWSWTLRASLAATRAANPAEKGAVTTRDSHKKQYRKRNACLRKSLCAVKGLG